MKWLQIIASPTVLLLMACTVPTDPWKGFSWNASVSGSIQDQYAQPVNGVEVLLRSSDGRSYSQVSGGTFGGAEVQLQPGHFFFFNVGSGQYSLRLTPPAGYTVPDAQPNPVIFTITGHGEDASVHLAVTLQKN